MGFTRLDDAASTADWTRRADEAVAQPTGEPQRALPAGSRFGRYAVVRLLGAGGMGAVYEAVHLDLKKRVALKMLRSPYASDPEVQTRFLREGEAASRIAHAHVVDVTDFGVCDGVPFLVMEYLEGECLGDRVTRGPGLLLSEVVDVMLPVCAGVSAAHSAGVVHRDLKPENIFLSRTQDGEACPKVVDFGVSKVIDPSVVNNLTRTSALVGSPMYMAPEQIRMSKQVDARSDQYALGVILYECTTGIRPFEGDSLYEMMHRIVRGEFTAPRVRRPDLSPEFEQVVLRAMALNPDERFPSVRELGRALLPFAGDRSLLLWSDLFAGAGSVPNARFHAREGLTPISVGAIVQTGGTLTKSVQSRDAAGETTTSWLGWLGWLGWPVWLGAGILAAAFIGAATWKFVHPAPRIMQGSHHLEGVHPDVSPPVEYRTGVIVQPSNAIMEIDGEPVGTGGLYRTFSRDGVAHTLRVHADGYRSRTVTFRDGPPPEVIALMPIEPSESDPPTQQVQLGASELRAAPLYGSPSKGGGHRGGARAVVPARSGITPDSPPVSVPVGGNSPPASSASGPAIGTNGAVIIP